MARKITVEAIEAFMAGNNFKCDNTAVSVNIHSGYVELYLHYNMIARRKGNVIEVTNAGWFSNTTKERLNGIPGVSVVQRKGVWYLNGVEWDGEWKKI